ncbi:hypothetical protein FNV43_RR21632 [Rhamnella rubrinervis]|uniref:Uncharacterized protein n=1 Tax=Rhamnella rubrinervis TaxID=2594499 RepID=A0A8K0GMD9_9ROSA|nr:hypothetical protein FNV43_RR21632 [Rhamnella rubrinervis]
MRRLETSRAARRADLEEEAPSTQLSEEIPEGIPLPTLEVPYLHILEGCIRLLYGVPTDPLWASYPAADMGKLKMKISKAELEATKKKKKDKQAAAKGGASSASDKGGRRPSVNASSPAPYQSPFPLATLPLPRGQDVPAPRPQLKIRAKKNKLHQCWGGQGIQKKARPTSTPAIIALAKTTSLKQTALEATKRAEQLERKWSEADQKLIEKDRELEALRLDYAQVAGERDAPSDEEEDGQEDLEITSGEDEPDEGDAPPVNQPDVPGHNAEPNDSFEEAMRLPSNEESGPGQTSRAANADDEAQD